MAGPALQGFRDQLAAERLLVASREGSATFGLQGALALRQGGEHLGPQTGHETGIDGHWVTFIGTPPREPSRWSNAPPGLVAHVLRQRPCRPHERGDLQLPSSRRGGHKSLGRVGVPGQPGDHFDTECLAHLRIEVRTIAHQHQLGGLSHTWVGVQPGRQGMQVGQARSGRQHHPIRARQHRAHGYGTRRVPGQAATVDQDVANQLVEPAEQACKHPQSGSGLVRRGRTGQHGRPARQGVAVRPHELWVAVPPRRGSQTHETRLRRPARRGGEGPARRVQLGHQD